MKYIVCEEMNFVWDQRDITEFEHMWREGLHIADIAKAFGRDVDEVVFLIIDRKRKGKIRDRQNGIYGRRRVSA